MPISFVPRPDSAAVQKLRAVLGTDDVAMRVKVSAQGGSKELDCYVNVRNKIQRDGYGKMLLGWAIWQHSHLFIEGERHAVFDPGDGRPWVDCTPHILPDGQSCREILFIPDKKGSYDFNTTNVADNTRVPLVDDPRVSEALRLFSRRATLMNSVPGIDIQLPQNVARHVFQLQSRASLLLSEAMEPRQPRIAKVGRNDSCPCGSGKKYKKCHGSNL
jgi:hypothetical protein